MKKLDLDSENTWLSMKFLLRLLSKHAISQKQLERQMINRKGFREAG